MCTKCYLLKLAKKWKKRNIRSTKSSSEYVRVFVGASSSSVVYMGTNRFTKEGGEDEDETVLSGKNPPRCPVRGCG